MNERRPKQVIVMRKDLGMRKGKMIAQGAHASMAAILQLLTWTNQEQELGRDFDGVFSFEASLDTKNEQDNAIFAWLMKPSDNPDVSGPGFAKICVYVNSEEELLEVYNNAKEAGILCALITDSGRTEFNGEATNTCIAIGPDWPENIDPITGHLKLL